MKYAVTFLLAILAAILLIRWLKIKTASIVEIGEVSLLDQAKVDWREKKRQVILDGSESL